MEHHTLNLKDLVTFVIGSFFLFGCIAGSQRTAKTLQPGQASAGLGYSHLENTSSSKSGSGIDLVDLNVQGGIAKGVEIGARHTFDLTSGNNSRFSTFWGDLKFQLNNLADNPGTPTFSIGLTKGYVYDQQAQTHITSVPFTLSSDFGPKSSGFIQYRHELMSSTFFPTDNQSFSNPRNVFVIGSEFALTDPQPDKWVPRLNFSVGFQNALAGGDFSLNSYSLNLGIWLDSPFSSSKK
jgi:hypothetical protein